MWRVVLPVQELFGGRPERFHRLEYLTMRHFTPQAFPEPLNRIELGTVCREIEQHEASSGAADYSVNFVSLMG